jgi:7-carboxy-7-deazaguanine synthase
VLDMVRAVAGNVRFIVITGGEPFMQLEPVLVELLVRDGFFIAVETNGSVDRKVEADWVTCSPKQPPETFSRFEACDELKVIFPSYDPHAYASRIMAKFNYVQPLAVTTGVGKSLIDRGNMARAVEWVLQNPGWRLSLQTHKMVGLP